MGEQTEAEPDFRFPKSARLLDAREFRAVTTQGRRYTAVCFNLLVRKSGQLPPRLGITVSRKVGKSVVRSRVKRVIREFFRLNRHHWRLGLECVVIAKPLAGVSPNAELTRNLHQLFLPLRDVA